MFRASPCPCGHPSCKDWHVEPVAAIQGVGFTEEQAKKVAEFMNNEFGGRKEEDVRTIQDRGQDPPDNG